MKKNLIDQTALITGASSGIGLQLTRRMLSEGWQIIALVRSEFPADDTLIQENLGKKQLRIYKADLTDFGSLRSALNQIKAKETKIDLLFNNAGGSFAELGFSRQKREMHFELQTVAPYIILMELKDLLLKGNLKTVVNTSTTAFRFTKKFDPDTLEHPVSFKKLIGPYAATKLALSLWTHEIAPLIGADGIKIRSADPGGNNTIRSGKKSGLPFYLIPIMKLFFSHPSQGASRLYEAAMGASRDMSGVFLVKNQVRELPFAEESRKVLEKVRAIYEQEFAVIANT
ncbi:NAD(P)-dependent dehydrogenase (short-subunit alcohol dehydrogenase family) [Paenibacillus castaneae]|uniref:SDR family NAD(P)-dependent oxidoreductase n=1 Tax=Paenibacillus castaneae TaxID=474957 RepID=UPI000C9CF473|nr:SDR family NAD(P)-dependent oxidoreductase [Paenibacillus castaneae]NIK77177.1 NAD(P)-dependent dehydrogenase (short-subunit alcohol dehydrogenase family) [Paenibacillus castaneae]